MSQIHIRFDWAIKKLLRQKANFKIFEGFLSELLREDIFIQEILESESNRDSAFDKQNRVDILVKNVKEELILIEVQNEREHDYFHRMAFGASKLITQYLSAGDPYDKIKKVYSVNIVYFNLGQGEDYIYEGTTQFVGLHKKDILGLSKEQIEKYGIDSPSSIFPTYFVLKLNSFDNIAKDSLDEWIYFLKNNEIKDEFSAKGIQEAKEKLRVDSLKGAEREDYDAFIKEQRIRQAEIDTALFDERLLKEEALREKEEAMRREEEERRQKDDAFRQKEEALRREEEERRQKEDAFRQKEEALRREEEERRQKLAAIRLLSQAGIPISVIAQNMGLSESQVNELLQYQS